MGQSIITEVKFGTDSKKLFNKILLALLEDGAPVNSKPEYSVRYLDNHAEYGYWKVLILPRIKKEFPQATYVTAIHTFIGNKHILTNGKIIPYQLEIKKTYQTKPVVWKSKSVKNLLDGISQAYKAVTYKLKDLFGDEDISYQHGYGIIKENNIIYIFKYTQHYGK